MKNIINTIYTGDNLYVLHGLNNELVDLIYLDPPFNSKKKFDAPIGSKAAGASFEDMWSWDDIDSAYLDEMITNYPFMVQFIQSIGRLHSASMKAYITYMSQRIIELHRILKNTGSFYLHCDTSASHYLKLVCDRIFGKNNFRNEITWKRSAAHSDAKSSYGRVTDSILFYTKSNQFYLNQSTIPHSEEYISSEWRKLPNGRYYKTENMLDPQKKMKEYSFHGRIARWRYTLNKNEELWNAKQTEVPNSHGRVKLGKDGLPLKRGKIVFLDELIDKRGGMQVQDLWDDIKYIAGRSKESTGYPTQKPLKLLERIIESSSKDGDLVLDPFCGCATTCVAAQNLNRKWIGIDISETAGRLVIERLTENKTLFDKFVHLKSNPIRTDLKEIDSSSRNTKNILYKNQDGKCNACETEMDERHFEIDHIIPRSKNGGDFIENLQLLCASCNRIKGDRPMAYLMKRIEKINKMMKFKVSFD